MHSKQENIKTKKKCEKNNHNYSLITLNYYFMMTKFTKNKKQKQTKANPKVAGNLKGIIIDAETDALYIHTFLLEISVTYSIRDNGKMASCPYLLAMTSNSTASVFQLKW